MNPRRILASLEVPGGALEPRGGERVAVGKHLVGLLEALQHPLLGADHSLHVLEEESKIITTCALSAIRSFPRFCEQFSESSPCLPRQQGRCITAVELSKNILQNLGHDLMANSVKSWVLNGIVDTVVIGYYDESSMFCYTYFFILGIS